MSPEYRRLFACPCAVVPQKLTGADVLYGTVIGMDRELRAIERGAHNRLGTEDADSFLASIRGALGECAFAKWRDIYFAPSRSGPDYTGDVEGYEVRTARADTHCLLIYPDNRDDRVYILVTLTRLPMVYLHGWIHGRDAKRPEWWDPGRADGGILEDPAFRVPHAGIHDLGSLPLSTRLAARLVGGAG